MVISVKKNVMFPTLVFRNAPPHATGGMDITIEDREAWEASLKKHAGIGGISVRAGLTY